MFHIFIRITYPGFSRSKLGGFKGDHLLMLHLTVILTVLLILAGYKLFGKLFLQIYQSANIDVIPLNTIMRRILVPNQGSTWFLFCW